MMRKRMMNKRRRISFAFFLFKNRNEDLLQNIVIEAVEESNMLFAIDIGNTHTVLGLYKQKERLYDWRIHTNHQATFDEYAIIIKNLLMHVHISFEQIKGCVISSVVPPLTETIRDFSRKYFSIEPIVLGPGIKTGLNILYENPREVGADRIANAIAAIEQVGAPVIIVDFGTATTFDLINEKGNYVGGAIFPGIQISSDSLLQKAAKLPRVEIAEPDHVIGKNPVQSIQAGLYFGYASLVDGMVTRMKALLTKTPKVMATGGLADLICKETKTIDDINLYLTLEGLRLIYERNQSR